VRDQDLDRGHVADRQHRLTGVVGEQTVKAGQHTLLNTAEGLPTSGSVVQGAQPEVEVVGVPLLDLGERHSLPRAELHLGQPVLDRHLAPQPGADDLRGLLRTADR